MTPEVKLKIARDCQALARKIGQLQNVEGVSLPRPSRLRRWVALLVMPFYIESDPGKYELTPKFVTDLTNALLSAGNILETDARTEAPQTLTPCTKDCKHGNGT